MVITSNRQIPMAILANLSSTVFTHFCIILFHNFFYFRMAFLKSLNATCNLNKYLFCKMPKGALEVEIKVKTTWGKFTMTQNTHTRMEKFCTWERPNDVMQNQKREGHPTRLQVCTHKITLLKQTCPPAKNLGVHYQSSLTLLIQQSYHT